MCTAAAAQTELTVFHVTGLPEPATLARVVEVFALRSLLPRTVAAEATGQDLRIALTLESLDPEEVDRLAERLRQIVIVDQVLVEARAA